MKGPEPFETVRTDLSCWCALENSEQCSALLTILNPHGRPPLLIPHVHSLNWEWPRLKNALQPLRSGTPSPVLLPTLLLAGIDKLVTVYNQGYCVIPHPAGTFLSVKGQVHWVGFWDEG